MGKKKAKRPSNPKLVAVQPAAPSNSLVGSAMRIAGPGAVPLPRGYNLESGSWANEAWRFYETVGELGFAANWIGNALSRVRLYAAQDQPGMDPAPLDFGPAFDAMSLLGGGAEGQQEMLRRLGVILTVGGQGYLIGEPADDFGSLMDANWLVVSGQELRRSGSGGYALAEAGRTRSLHPDTLVTRIWRSHPRMYWEPDSPTRRVLPVLAELDLLTQHILASAQSRLAGAGILVLPQELSFPAAGPLQSPEQAATDPFLVDLTDAMLTAISDRADPAAVVPIVLRVPGEFVDKIQHLKFDVPLDSRALELRNEAIRRMAAGMDVPSEIVLGLGDVNHWSAWQLSEQATTIHIVPLAQLIAYALTENYLHPVLEAMGQPTDGVLVGIDTTALTQRPNLAADAFQLYDRDGIGVDTLRRAAGFADDDAPTEDEMRLKVVLKLAESQPSLAPCLLPLLGIELPEACLIPGVSPLQVVSQVPAQSVEPGAPAELPPAATPTTGPPGTQGAPPPAGASAAALVAACEALVWRALERAGARLRSVTSIRASIGDCPPPETHVCLGGVPVARLNDLLVGAWDRAPALAVRYQVDPHQLVAALDVYTRMLLTSGLTVELDNVADALERALA